jgi:hypothetical protein
MKSEMVETKTVRIWMEDGLMFITLLPKAILTLAEAKKNVVVMQKLAGGQKRPVLTNMQQIGWITREAGIYSAGEDVQQVVSALAVLVGSSFTKTLANLWKDFEKPSLPYEIFTSESGALAWLKGFLE